LEEHARKLEATAGLKISCRTVDRVFQRHGITYKKMRVASERRQQVLTDRSPDLRTPARLIFLDESGFNTAMTRPHGRAQRTRRVSCAVPRN
jgi:hypothetical protein